MGHEYELESEPLSSLIGGISPPAAPGDLRIGDHEIGRAGPAESWRRRRGVGARG